MRREERSRSPVSVHEWVAALPDISKDTETEDNRTEERDNDIAEDDNLTLGAEGDSLLVSVFSSDFVLQPEDITLQLQPQLQSRMLASSSSIKTTTRLAGRGGLSSTQTPPPLSKVMSPSPGQMRGRGGEGGPNYNSIISLRSKYE